MTVNGYKTKTTFYNDFTIADFFGAKAVKDTYERAFNEWKDNVVYLTELVLVMNWKCWYWYNKGNIKLSMLYKDLYYKAHNYARRTLKGAAYEYYFNITD